MWDPNNRITSVPCITPAPIQMLGPQSTPKIPYGMAPGLLKQGLSQQGAGCVAWELWDVSFRSAAQQKAALQSSCLHTNSFLQPGRNGSSTMEPKFPLWPTRSDSISRSSPLSCIFFVQLLVLPKTHTQKRSLCHGLLQQQPVLSYPDAKLQNCDLARLLGHAFCP